MEWRDEGLIIGLRRHGETSLIVELMTRSHGRHLGIVKGGRSKRMQPLMQQGNSVEAVWRARLEEHLGLWQLDVLEARASAIMESGLALNGIGLLAELLRLLPERDPHAGLYEMALAVTGQFGQPLLAGELMVRFELALLAELGFGVDLSACAATGRCDDLIYVSPKSARAVSADAGRPYADRLLLLPAFLLASPGSAREWSALEAGFAMTGHFLRREVFEARHMAAPDCRRAFIAAVQRALGAAGPDTPSGRS